MIRATTLSKLTARDITHVVLLLSHGLSQQAAILNLRLESEGPGVLLDDPELAGLLLSSQGLAEPSQALFVYVIVRHHLLKAGFPGEELADYLASLVIDFGNRDRSKKLNSRSGDSYHYLVDLLIHLEHATGEERFLTLAHLGNYSLWIAGLFPDRIVSQKDRRGGPGLAYYDQLGRRGFGAASDHFAAEQAGLEGIYRTVADCFPSLRATFNTMSDRYFFPAMVSNDRILRELGRSDQ